MSYFRIKLLQEYLKDNALDAFLVLTKVNRQYVSSFTGSAGVVVITKRGGELYVDNRYLIRAKLESPFGVRDIEILPRLWRVRMTNRIGIEDRITLRELKWLRKTVKAKFIQTKDVIENLRAVKSKGEIGVIRECQRIVDQIFYHIKKFVRVGMTEAAVGLEIERYAKKLGAQGMAFDSIVAFGANAAAPHHLSGNQKIKRNNFLLLDFGVMVRGYHSDFTRTLFLGKPNKKQEKVYSTVLEAQIRGIGEIREGTVAAVVDAAARGYIEREGFRKYFSHNTGHGVGLEIHELPNFSPKSQEVLKKNMIVTVEPGIYIEKWGGVRIEDMVVVGEKGPIILSKIPKNFEVMIVR